MHKCLCKRALVLCFLLHGMVSCNKLLFQQDLLSLNSFESHFGAYLFKLFRFCINIIYI